MDFKKKIDEINTFTSKEQKKNIHFKSLRNFIYHYDSVKKEKVKVAKLLEEYIKLIESKDYLFTLPESKNVFSLFINELGMKYYRRYLNFTSNLSVDLIILFYTVPNIIVYFILESNTIKISFLSLSSLFLVAYIIKFFKKKIFGYRY